MEFIIQFLSQYPIVLKILVYVGMARVIFKPLCAGIAAYVGESESKKDDSIWESVKANAVYKAIAFIMDYSASIKLPK